jgi:hypothetical protein
VERIPLPFKKRCYGTGYQHSDDVCQSCSLKENCRMHMGRRSNRVPVNSVRFILTPEALLRSDSGTPKQNIAEAFQMSFKRVYGKSRRLPFTGRIKDFTPKVAKNLSEARVSPDLYFTTLMWAYKKTNPDLPLYATYLVGESALKRFTMYRQAVEAKYGTFDSGHLEAFNSDSKAHATFSLRDRLLNSEITAGQWIIGYKRYNSGKFEDSLYSAKELDMDPAWLAIEPTYFDTVLKTHLDRPFGTAEQQRHRSRVVHVRHRLRGKYGKVEAKIAFCTRENIMSKAVETVLSDMGYRPHDFEIEDSPIVHPLKFWSRLGLAVQHVGCLAYLNGVEIGSFRNASTTS